MAIFWKKKQTLDEQSIKEAYFTASQWQLIRARYRSNRTAMIAGWILTLLILAGLFSEFLSPYPYKTSLHGLSYTLILWYLKNF